MGTGPALAAEVVPAGPPLRIGEITLVTGDIFSPAKIHDSPALVGFLRGAMNGLHTNTRPGVLRRELLFRTGDPYDPRKLEETERNLRTLGFLNTVAVTAVDTTADGLVRVEVATRESWSLQTTFAYARASSGDQRWNVQLSEQNFLGHGVVLGLGAGSDEDSGFWNLWYRQRRLLGTGLWFGVDASDRQDGHIRKVFLSRPFWAQEDRWGLDLTAWDRAYEIRYYLSNAGPAGQDPTRPASLHALLPYRDRGIDARAAVRAWGRTAGRIWRIGGGVRVTETRYDLGQDVFPLSDGRLEPLAWLGRPGEPVARESGVAVLPYAWIHALGRNWTESRFVLQYGTDEDVPLDTVLDVMVGPETRALGSTTGQGEDRLRGEGWVQRWVPAGGGLVLLRAEGEAARGRVQPGYHRWTATAGWVGATAGPDPWLSRVFVEFGQGSALEGSRALVLGLDRGLRSLEFDGMAGDRLARWSLEQGKALPGEALGLFRYGAAAFYSGGAAWWSNEDRGLEQARHEAGIGLRFGPTRSANAQIGRIDLAWDLQGGTGPVLTATTRGLF